MKTLIQPTDVTNAINTVETVSGPLTSATYPVAEEALVVCKAILATGKKLYKRMLDPLNERRRVILDWRANDLEVVQTKIALLTTLIADYQRVRELEQEAAATKALADAKVEAERVKAEQIAELESLASELEVLSPEHAHSTKERVEQVKNAPAPMVAVLPDNLEEFSDADSKLSHRDVRTVEVVDMVLLAEAVATRQLPPDVLKPNMPELHKLVKASDDAIPGCRTIVRRSFRRKAVQV
jgi:hypothetical protein